MRSFVPLVLLVLFIAPAAHAQSLRDWTNYTDVNDVNSITSYGDTIWLATNGGLVRFLESDPSNEVRLTNADGLGDNQLRFVTIDSNGVLWCGGENGRLSRRRHDKSWTVYPFEDENGLPIRLNAAAPGPDGFLWVASDKGVHKFDTQRNGGEIKESYTRIGEWPDESAINDIQIQSGDVLVGSDLGIAKASIHDPFLLDRSHWVQSAVPEAVKRVLAPEGAIFIGTPTDVYRFSGGEWETANWIGPIFPSPFRSVVDLSFCQDELWIAFDIGYGSSGPVFQGHNADFIPGAVPSGFTSVHCTENAVYFGQTDAGVWRLKDDVWTHIELNGPLDNNLSDIAVDAEGRVWTTHLNRGASFFDDGQWNTIPYIEAGPGGPITSVDVAPDGGVWFGLWGNGVWHVDPDHPLDPSAAVNFRKNNSSLMWVGDPQDEVAFNYLVVLDVKVDHQGRVWAANAFADSGAVIAWNDHGCWGRFDINDGLTSNSPSVLYPLDSSILVGFANVGIIEVNFREPLCSGGQVIPQTARLSQKTTEDGLPSDLVTAILYDNLDSLWVGTNLGLAHYSRDRRRFFRVDMPPDAGLTVNALAVDANNGLWIGTALGLVVREADGTMHFYNSLNSGLVGDNVSEIDIDSRTGDVWIATHSGISQTRGPLPTVADIENIVAYPNPFVIGEADHVRFNAPSASRITITTVSGHQVNVIDSDVGWDGRNSAGELVATGVYLFVVSTPAGDFGRGKIAVIHR